MILTVGNIKGGVGKTLLAVNIAAVLAHRGRDVLLIDGDEQGSAATFAGIRAEIAAPVAFATIRLQGALHPATDETDPRQVRRDRR